MRTLFYLMIEKAEVFDSLRLLGKFDILTIVNDACILLQFMLKFNICLDLPYAVVLPWRFIYIQFYIESMH